MAGGLRKPHSKSRNGCKQCKARRVKCDCRGPRCHNCERRNAVCEYPEFLEQARARSQPSSESLRSQYVRPHLCVARREDQGMLRQPSRVDALSDSKDPIMSQLFVHWAEHTCFTVGATKNDAMRRVWQVVMPEVALNSVPLAHSICSFSAAHIASLDPERRSEHLRLARHYNVEALAAFRSKVASGYSDSESIGIFGFCVLTMLTSMALMQADVLAANAGCQDVDAVLAWLLLVRRSAAFASSLQWSAEDLQGAASILAPRNRKTPKAFLVPDRDLLASLDGLMPDGPAADALGSTPSNTMAQAITATKSWYRMVPLHPLGHEFIPQWLQMLPDDFFGLLRTRYPPALALLAYFLVPLHNGPQDWFIQFWPRRTIATILRELGDEWSERMSWLRSHTGL